MKICNLDYLKSVTPGSNAFAIEIIKLFLQDIPESITVIKTELQNANFEGIYKHAHKIKPSLDLLGMNVAFEEMQQIEVWANSEGKKKSIKETYKSVANQIEKAVKEIKKDFNLN